MRHIELLQAHGPTDGVRQRPQQLVEAHIKHRQVRQHPYLRREARPERVVHQNNLVQPLHVADSSRHAAVEAVVGQHDHRHGGVPKVVRQVEHEAVVVDENGVEVLVKELLGDRAFEFVEPQI